MSHKTVISRDGGILTITLADPDNRNVLSVQMLEELSAAIDLAESDETVRVVVLTNQGHVFSAGADLAERSAGDPAAGTVAMAQVFSRIVRSPKPFVGQIAGHAVAGGVGLAAALDISVAADDSRFGFSEVRVGVAPAIISVICLPKMTRAGAAAAFLQGNRFLAPEAARLGLINEAVPAPELAARVAEITDDLLLGGPTALAAAKQLLWRIPGMEFEAALDWATGLSAGLFAGSEAAEGMAAYLEKRPPDWAPEDTG